MWVSVCEFNFFRDAGECPIKRVKYSNVEGALAASEKHPYFPNPSIQEALCVFHSWLPPYKLTLEK